jgi:APA family basic amino acid/polyamine antiporter
MSAPRRSLGGLHATAVVIGAIIGVGIFLTPGKVAAVAGSAEGALLLWAAGGVIALAGALSMAEIGARFPTSGGEIVALQRMLGPLPAFLFGWCLLTAIQTGVLVIVTLFAAQNLAAAAGAGWEAGAVSGAATAMLAALMAVNLLGVRQGAAAQTTTVALKLLALAALTAVGAYVALGGEQAAPVAVPAATAAPAEGVPWLAGLAACLFSYGGFHQVTWVGGEVRDPQRVLPRAILVGVVIVVVSYLAANLTYFGLLPFEVVTASSTLAADAVGTVLPGWGRRITAAALAVSAFGLANTLLLTSPRVYFALAQEGLFPRALGRLDGGRAVPAAAIWLQGGLAIVLLWVAGGEAMDQLVNGVVFLDWIFHLLACAGLILVWRRGEPSPGFRAPAMPLPPLVFVLGTLVALGATFLDPAVRRSSLLGLVWVGAGCLVYFLVLRRRGLNPPAGGPKRD